MTPSTVSGNRTRHLRRTFVAAALAAGVVALPAAPAFAQPSSGSAGSSSGSGSSTGSGSSDFALPISSPAGLIALAAATTQTGKPYLWGGTGPNAWDCSGLTQWAFRQAGVNLPRVSQDQAWVGASIPFAAMAPGDIITFRTANDHVGIYAGFGQVLNAYGAGVPVGLTPLSELPPINQIRRF
ncbi:C40 family peptidase [Rhodococcus tukisamuensis]|uniref:Cell wall-associated hydrolase, NlpC family n=1 Tax=Rhodococcus tukisamuensis TaxID=168276 RepID=A0A1G6VQ82_9NOCA|nr:NlpC/P60 family protein [Rhodococcus tukisamuensis]SDD55762.1 Cell wall-associated hydrolase, NlpC family [Rhodococcus tukisamuensis]